MESIKRDALKILNQAFDDAYTKQHRTTIGGNEYVHAVRKDADSTRTAEINRNDVEKNLLF
jgi:hypothetical protein